MKKKKRQKSIFSRLVKSYVLFILGTILMYLVVAVAMLMYLGNGNVDNVSPQTVVKNDGTVNDIEVLKRVGGWVEEVDEEGNIINVIGDKKTDKQSYTLTEMASLLDMGYVTYSSSGMAWTEYDVDEKIEYSGIVRCVGDPQRIYLVVYPFEMVTYKATYNVTNGSGNNALIFLAVFIALFLAVVLLISFYLKRHIEKPLKLLMDGMDEVSEGKRDVVLDYKTDKEFEDIRDRFNRMAEKLKETEDEKHRIEQSRNQMLLELAHDIKNPVASIKSSVCALQEGLVTEDKVQDYYRTIELKAERIRTLTDDINTDLKMESDDYKLNLEKADVCELVRRICVEFYEDITATGKEFDIDIPDDELKAEVDSQLFGRVINNLLVNANKYNTTGQNIWIRVYTDNDQIVTEVMDDGEAIAEDFVPRMFEAFSRGDSTRKTDGGTGLGLAISRKIIEKHKGTLKYVRAEDRNCFCVRISKA